MTSTCTLTLFVLWVERATAGNQLCCMARDQHSNVVTHKLIPQATASLAALEPATHEGFPTGHTEQIYNQPLSLRFGLQLGTILAQNYGGIAGY